MVKEINLDEVGLPRSELDRILHTKTQAPPPAAGKVKKNKHKRVLPASAAPLVERHASGRKKYMG